MINKQVNNPHTYKIHCSICNTDVSDFREHVMSEKHCNDATQIITEVSAALKSFNQLKEGST